MMEGGKWGEVVVPVPVVVFHLGLSCRAWVDYLAVVSGEPKCGNVPNAEGRMGQSRRLCREQAVVQAGKVEHI
jgi:hypothetical protein